jgi:hypothetical protein
LVDHEHRDVLSASLESKANCVLALGASHCASAVVDVLLLIT